MSKENILIVIKALIKQIEIFLPCLVVLIILLAMVTYIIGDRQWLRKLINKMI